MPMWLIFAVLVTIAVTAALTAVLYRINMGADPAKRSGDDAGDQGRGGCIRTVTQCCQELAP